MTGIVLCTFNLTGHFSVSLVQLCSKTKGSCKSYVDTCHTSDKGKGRGSPALANSPAPRPQSSKKVSSSIPSQQQKKHKVSVYYSKYKPSSSTAAPDAMTAEEECEDLTPDPLLNPDLEVCSNNNNISEPAFISQLDKNITRQFMEDPQSTRVDSEPAVMFPMETPAGFPDNITVGPGPRPGLLVCSPAEKACAECYIENRDSEKRDKSELEVRKLPLFTHWYIRLYN